MLVLSEAEKDLLAELEKIQSSGRIGAVAARGLVMRGLIDGPAEARRLTQAGAAMLHELRLRSGRD
ncbi:MAG: hypothetical protein ACREVL_16435 [Solimonas sp.]